MNLPRKCDYCGEDHMYYGRCQKAPGTATFTYGTESVTLDPIAPREEFERAQQRWKELSERAFAHLNAES